MYRYGHILSYVSKLTNTSNFPKRICNTPLTFSPSYDYENVSTASVCIGNNLSLQFDIRRKSQRGLYETSQ